MSHTLNIGSRTRTNTSTSQRGKQGRGIKKKFTQSRTSKNNHSQQLQNCNIAECSFENPRVRNHEIYENIKFPNNRGHRRPERGGQTLRNHRPNSETTGTFKRSHYETSNFNSIHERTDNSSLPKEAVMFNNDSSRLPKHAQNPIFVGELMQRFNSIMPTSNLLSDEPQQHIQREKIVSLSYQNNKTLANPPQSFASISNNVSHGFRNNHSRSPNNPLDQTSSQEINRNNNRSYSSNNAKTCSEIVVNNTTKDRSCTKSNYIKKSQLASNCGSRFDHSMLSNVEGSKTKESFNISSDSQSFTKNLTSLTQQTTGINWDKPNPGLDSSKFTANDKTRSKDQQTRSGDNNVKMPVQKMAENLSELAIKHSRHEPKPKTLSPTKKPPTETSKVKNATDIERRNQILLAHGFKGKNNENVISSEEHTMNSRESSPGETLFSQIKEFNLNNNNSFKHNGEINKSQSKIKTRIQSCEQQSIQQQFDLPKQIENFNNFLISQHTSEKKPPKPGAPITKENPSNTSSSAFERQGLTDGIFAGRPHFSINQSVASANQRGPTRSDAIQRFEEEYTIKRLEHEAKEREKDAIKRERYLAKYKHVDQGHRLDDGYFDEAVGYDPGFPLFESEEDVRKRQQEQLWQDSLIFQQVEKEKNDQRKKQEEEMKRQRLNKHLQNINAGYTLGFSNNTGPSQGARPKTISSDGLESQDRKEHKKLGDDEIRKARLAKLLAEQELPNKNKPNPVLTGNSQMVAVKQSSPTHQAEAKSVEKLIQNNAAVEIRTKQLNENDKKELIKFQLQTKLENLMSKPTKSSENETIGTTKPTEATRSIKPASCVLKKSSQGADSVLVLRPTEKTLNQALVKKLDVIDQMDKHGDSALYKPQVHPAPLYANNRFQCEPVADIGKATGAIPKHEPQVQVVHPPDRGLTSSSSSQNSSVSNRKTDQDVSSVDYQAEMRAARLRMQQKYEETLKKQ